LIDRHYGLDWLRIGAFGVLILYHVGMVFVHWDFHVKLPGADWVAVGMHASNAWRLCLLFVVSGYASRALFSRSGGPGGFAWARTKRLVIPLLFGMAVILPPQPWVELTVKHGYQQPFGWFWVQDYFDFRFVGNVAMPTWNHLWFVVYLWLYTLVLAGAVALTPARARAAVQRGFERVFAGIFAVVLPALYLVWVKSWWLVGQSETHDLVNDVVAHAIYLPALLFGFALAGAPQVLAAFRRWWPAALAVAVLAYGVAASVELRWPGFQVPTRPWGTIFAIAQGIEGWAAVAALIGIADRFWNHDHPARPVLTEAVFPFYIVHQTIIVVVAYWLIAPALPPPVNFALLVAATAAGCWLFYVAGRSIGWLRPLIGLRARAKRAA
jgi:hypothetical protein